MRVHTKGQVPVDLSGLVVTEELCAFFRRKEGREEGKA